MKYEPRKFLHKQNKKEKTKNYSEEKKSDANTILAKKNATEGRRQKTKTERVKTVHGKKRERKSPLSFKDLKHISSES